MGYQVKVTCKAGRSRLHGDRWESVYHTITWATYDTKAEADRIAAELVTNPTARNAFVIQEDKA